MNINGLDVYVDDNLTKKIINVCRSKKKRIKKKWYKNQKNYRYVPMPFAFRFENKLIMHPAMFEKLKKATESFSNIENATFNSGINSDQFRIKTEYMFGLKLPRPLIDITTA